MTPSCHPERIFARSFPWHALRQVGLVFDFLSKWISKAKKDEILKQVLAFGKERSAGQDPRYGSV
jgi:hypothetical protein